MEMTGEFSDRCLAVVAQHIDTQLALTLDSMPDICVVLFAMNLWAKKKKISGPYRAWATLLIKATPLPCKGRNLENAFSEAVEDPVFYDFIVRVLAGAFLGLYGGTKAPFWTRVWCYAAFVLKPPDIPQLQAFILQNKAAVAVSVENFILFSYALTPFADFFARTYAWDAIVKKRVRAMEALQEHVLKIADNCAFMSDWGAWAFVENLLLKHTVDFKKLCFRSIVMPFCSKIVEEGFKVWRRETQEKCFSGRLLIAQEYLEHVWTVPYSPDNQKYLDAHVEVLPPKYFDDSTIAAYTASREAYYMERNSTSPQHLMSGTEKRKSGLYFKDPQAFFDVFGYCFAANHRLKIRWGLIPREWALAQAHALLGGRDALPPDAGVYFLCPNCSKIRTRPVTYPAGSDDPTRSKGLYPHQVRFDLGTRESYCKDFSFGRKKQILKRRQRKRVLTETEGDNIKVCSLTPLTRICMIGVLLTTEQDGNLILCVDCGTMIAWTPQCLSERGPTCGCAIKPQAPRPIGECGVCEAALYPSSDFRQHDVLDGNSVTTLYLCSNHYSHWVTKLQYILPKKVVVEAVRKFQYAILYNGVPIFLDRTKKKRT